MRSTDEGEKQKDGLKGTRETEGRDDLIKVSNDLIQQPQAFYPHVVSIQFNVEVVEVRNGGKQHSDLGI